MNQNLANGMNSRKETEILRHHFPWKDVICILDGVVIAAKFTATFSDLLRSPVFRY